MKINYKNTALGLLDKMGATQFRIIDDGGVTTMDDKLAMSYSLIEKWENFNFGNRRRYMSEPFYKAYEKGVHKLAGVLDAEPMNESGTLIFKPSNSETNTIFYNIKTWGQKESFDMDATIVFFNSDIHKDKPALAILAQRRPKMPLGAARFYASKKAIEVGLTASSVIADIFTLLLFLKYCPVETKIIPASKKDKHVGVKYVNDTKGNIEILDSSYFTTIVKSEGFGVRGHFRFQPYGPGMQLRKLIWIDAFEKEGYTRTAKVLNQNTNE